MYFTIADLERLSLVMRTSNSINAGATTFKVRSVPEGIIGEEIVIDILGDNPETRTVTAQDNKELTVAALTYAHAPDAAVVRKIFATYGSSGTQMFLADDVAAPDTTITVKSSLIGLVAECGWLVIDPYTSECEIRKPSAVSGTAFTIPALTYSHSENDAILWVPEPTAYVNWFGATGDGTTDDAAAIQAAIDAAEAAGGGTVSLPQGTYLLKSGLTIEDSEVGLVGSGSVTILTDPSFTTGNVVYFNMPGIRPCAGISNINFECGLDADANTLICINIFNCTYGVFEELYIHNFYQGILCTCYIKTFFNVRIRGTEGKETTIGMEFTRGAENHAGNSIVLLDVTIDWCITGLFLHSCTTINAVKIDVENCTTGISITNEATVFEPPARETRDINIQGHLEHNDVHVAIAGTSTEYFVEGVVISGFMTCGVGDTSAVSLTYCRNVTLRSCTLDDSNHFSGDIISIGEKVENLGIENCYDIYGPLIAPNFIASIGGAISRHNLVKNGSFDLWSRGGVNVPDGWELVSGATVTREADARDGKYAAEVMESGGSSFLRQIIPIPEAYQKSGVTATLVADVKHITGHAANITLVPKDNAGTQQGTLESRESNEEAWVTLITKPVIFKAETTRLHVLFYPDDGNSVGKVSRIARVAVYYGNTAWGYEEHPIDTRLLERDLTGHNHGEAGTVTLKTYTLPAYTVPAGYGVRVRIAGTCTGTTDAKEVGIKVGGTLIAKIQLAAGEEDNWYIEVEGYRKDVTTALAWFIKTQQGTAFEGAPYLSIASGVAFTSDVDITSYATLANAADEIIQKIFIVELV